MTSDDHPRRAPDEPRDWADALPEHPEPRRREDEAPPGGWPQYVRTRQTAVERDWATGSPDDYTPVREASQLEIALTWAVVGLLGLASLGLAGWLLVDWWPW